MVNLINKQIKHAGGLGIGTVIGQNDKYITVQFASKTSKFAYPAAFKAFLVPIEQSVADAIKTEIKAMKATEQEAKAKESAKKVAE